MSDQPLAPHLSSDRPIGSLSEDVLGRGEFAVALANAFIRWRGEESLVVALYGPWGSGKSSVKNMVLDLIRRHEADPAVIEFNPWAWSGRDRLLSAFFSEIGIALGKRSEAKDAGALAAKWRQYAARLSFAGTVITAIKTGTQAAGIPVVPIVLEGLAGGVKQVSEVAEAAGNAHGVAAGEEPLDELKRDLAESLRGLEAPLLVVMDDVDRLTIEEIRLLFQLIKVNADFPRVVYFLLFDRGIVEGALEGVGGASGRDYMEKIVQAGFDLPKVDRSDLDTMFFDGLNRLLDFGGSGRTFDRDRWGNLYSFGLRPILGTPRDIRRFLSAFSFAVGLFHRRETLEVNVIDLIGIEVLRIFEPGLYHELPEQKALLLGSGSSAWPGRDDRAERKQEIERLVGLAGDEHRQAATAILKELFPAVDWTLKGYLHGQGFEAGWLRELRICHRDVFDRYFSLAVPRGDVPQSLIDALLWAAGDRRALSEVLASLNEEGRLAAVLKRLEAYTPTIDLGAAVPFVTSLMDVGDSLPERGPGLYEIGDDLIAYRIIYHLLSREQDAKARGRLLLEAVAGTDGLYLPLRVVSLELHRGEKVDPHDPSLLDAESSGEARRLCASKIEAAASAGELIGPRLGFYLWRWREFGGGELAMAFAASITSSPDGALRFLRGFVQEVRSQSEGRVVTYSRWGLDLKNIEPFVDVGHLTAILEPLLGADVPPEWMAVAADYEKEIGAFRQALGRRARGEPDDFFDSAGE